MPKAKNIPSHIKHLLMTLTLLWALMLNGQEVVAYTSIANGTTQDADHKLAHGQNQDHKTVVKQKISLEATTSFVALNLQPTFAYSSYLLLPAYTTIPPSVGFLAQIFPITIQPNAP
jgi:hypothetical protein